MFILETTISNYNKTYEKSKSPQPDIFPYHELSKIKKLLESISSSKPE